VSLAGSACPSPRSRWLWVYWAVVAIGFAGVLAINLPGQASFDTVMELYQGRNSHQITFDPWIVSWLLGIADRLSPGTGLFMLLDATVLFACLAALPLLRARTSRWAVLALALVLLTPQIVNYQGIVWKDVLFANLTVAGFVSLAFGLKWTNRPRLGKLALAKALVLLAVAGLVRQNGLIDGALAALAFGAAEGYRLDWKQVAIRGLAALAAVLALALVLGAVIHPATSDLKANAVGLRIVRHYDIVGAVARDPKVDLGAVPLERAAVIRAEAGKLYTPERIDTLDDSPTITRALWQTPKAALASAWWGIVLHRPGLYLSHRLAVFDQLLLTPKLDRCVPVAVGVDGPAQYRDALGLKEGVNRRDVFLSNYAAAFYQTPVFSHLLYVILDLALLAALAVRRQAADLAVMGLLLAGLGFAASFFLIGIACDYRYLYMLDLATLVGLVYWALDPPPLPFKASPPA
jgi:hypothetical protein